MAFWAAIRARSSPVRLAGAHHRLAHLGHDRADVGEVEVDQARQDHQVGDRPNARVQHLVGHAEGFGEGRALVGDAEQVLVRNDDQGVDVALQLTDAGVGQTHAVTAFEVEGLGDHADGQDAALTGALGDDRGGAGAGAAAHAGGDEDHVSAVEVLADLREALFSGAHAHFGVRAGAQALGDLHAELDAAVRLGELQLLGVGVGHHELNPLEARLDHVVHGVAASAADAEHHDTRLQFGRTRRGKRNCHGTLVVLTEVVK
jgi:hypothetical protein